MNRNSGLEAYQQVVRARRAGLGSQVYGSSPHAVVKPEYYFDGRSIIGDVLQTYRGYSAQYPPYGLVDGNNRRVDLRAEQKPWRVLEDLMSSMVERAFNETAPSLPSCPYHEALGHLNGIPAQAFDHNMYGLDELRRVTLPGGVLAPNLIVNLVRRIPAMAAIHGATTPIAELAANSERSLLTEPLGHPQQWAKPFIYTLANGWRGRDLYFERENFMPPEVISNCTELITKAAGTEQIGWSMPTEDFILRASVRVLNRVQPPPPPYAPGENTITYPIGTRLGDIAVTEPTIGCPGNQMAYYMYQQTVGVAEGEGLWGMAA